MSMAHPIVVVGGGIVGTAIACRLQARGVETVLVERDSRPQGASFFSFASLTALDEPVPSLFALKCAGMDAWRRWQQELSDDLGVSWDGEIRWAETPQAAEQLQAKIAEGARRGYAVRALDAQELEQRLPNSRPTRVLAASYAPDDGQADPPRSIARMRQSFADSGGTSLVGRASLRFDEGEVHVRVGGDELLVSNVVVATGVETTAFLEKLGWDIPVDAVPGMLVLTEPAETVIPGAVYVNAATEPSIHLRQRGDGSVLIGEKSQEYSAGEATSSHARVLLQQAQQYFPGLAAAGISDFTVEERPMPRDSRPIIGSLPGMSSVYVATGHSGITLAPAIADLAAQELVDGEPARQLDDFRPARFSRSFAGSPGDSAATTFEVPAEIFLG